MYVLDCGKNSSTLYNSEDDTCKVISHQEVLDLPNTLPEWSNIICEYAHLGCPREAKSKAQPFTGDQLLKLYKDFEKRNIKLRLFPQQSTPRAQNYSQLPKSDLNDPKSIYLLLKDFPKISLMTPPEKFGISKLRQESYDFKDETNFILNIARKQDYDPSNANFKFLEKHATEIFNNLPKFVEDAFSKKGSFRFKKGNKNKKYEAGDINFNQMKLSQIYSILCLLQDYDGNLRLREKTGRLAGWKFIKNYVLCMSPFHLKGGVARSNLYFHGLRHWVSRKAAEELGVTKKYFVSKRRGGYYKSEDGAYVEPFTTLEDDIYLKYRRQYCKAVKLLYIECKRILEREYNLLETNNGVQELIPALA